MYNIPGKDVYLKEDLRWLLPRIPLIVIGAYLVPSIFTLIIMELAMLTGGEAYLQPDPLWHAPLFWMGLAE